MSGKVGGAAAVGKRLHISRRTVFNLEKIGLPKLGPGKYDLDACEKWYTDYSAREAMPPEVVACSNIAEVAELLRKRLYDALDELASDAFVDGVIRKTFPGPGRT